MIESLSTSWHTYPQIFNVGHRKVQDIFKEDVLIEEKVDGSQFSFARINGVLRCRSKGCEINTDYPEKMFKAAIDYVKSLEFNEQDLHPGWTYRAEYLARPKHNALCYDRIPNHNLIVFDINPAEETYLSYAEKKAEAERIGLECVPMLFAGHIESPESLLKLLETQSILGGQKIEGFVIKNYSRFTEEKKAMMGKYVSEAFKEVHNKEWKADNQNALGIIELLTANYRTPARWNKSIQHLREAGKLEGSPKDIGFLIKEIGDDVEKECADEIKDKLYEWAWHKIRRGLMAGFPEHYKEMLLRESFDNGDAGAKLLMAAKKELVAA